MTIPYSVRLESQSSDTSRPIDLTSRLAECQKILVAKHAFMNGQNFEILPTSRGCDRRSLLDILVVLRVLDDTFEGSVWKIRTRSGR